MAYTVLARRYRSTTFDEVIGQEHIAQTLKKAIESGRVAHAYLFCGTRGTGKTSMARILAKAMNCQAFDSPTTQPCGTCNSCQAIARGDDIDVIEIDAASNTGVDNVRDVIENSQYRPARARFKIYIVDEAHMLSKPAFNALLKTLEEPPDHVKFILATTEPEKILPTILSRCQRYDFRNIATREIAGHLAEICTQEGIEADADALGLVAKAGAGSMRDALSLLDRLLSAGEKRLSAELVEQLLGMPRTQVIFELVESIGRSDIKATLLRADAIVRSGLSVDALLASLVDHLRNLLVLRTCGIESQLVEAPGMALEDLANQAGRFEAMSLTQDIAILEELRRQARQSQGGRALLDATLARLALAEQFASVEQLLSRVDSGSGGQGAQKKKPELNRPTESAGLTGASAVSPAATSPPSAGLPRASAVGASAIGASAVSPAVTSPPSGGLPRASAAAPAAASPAPAGPRPGVAADDPPEVISADASNVSADEDDDDDLPRPGKVWESGGPSLKELLAEQERKNSAAAGGRAVAAPTPPAPAPVASLTDLWQSLLDRLYQRGPSIHALVIPGRLESLDEGLATIRYPAAQSTFIKLLERNGKKEIVRDLLGELIQRPVGLRLEADAEEAELATAHSPPSPTAQMHSRLAASAGGDEGTAGIVPPASDSASTGLAMTPELLASVEADELVHAVMTQLGGRIIKIEQSN